MRREVLAKHHQLIRVDTTFGGSKEAEIQITDSFLRALLEDKRRSKKLTDIIASIQKNQNQIISLPMEESFIVQGCAGSGKTMVLLHRLSKLIYNNRKFDHAKIVIISPNEDFNIYIDELSETLEIGDIRKFSVESFYSELIHKLTIVDVVSKRSRVNEENQQIGTLQASTKIKAPQGRAASESLINEECIREIYSLKFLQEYEIEYHRSWNETLALLEEAGCFKLLNRMGTALPNKDKHVFRLYSAIEQGLLALQARYLDTTGTLAAVTKRLDRQKARLEATKQARIAIDKKIKSSADEVLHMLDAEIKAIQVDLDNLSTVPEDKYKAKKRELQSRLETIGACSKMLDRGKYPDLKAKLPKKSFTALNSIISGYVEAYDALTESDKKFLHIEENVRHELQYSIAQLEEEWLEMVDDLLPEADRIIVEKSLKLVEKLDVRFFDRMLTTMRLRVFRKYNEKSDASVSYRFLFYMKLLVCSLYYENSTINFGHVSIDEAQDISPAEYVTIKRILGEQVVLNLYGDTKQLISESRGISDWSLLDNIIPGKRFVLRENFRNSIEIQDYCNTSFGYDIETFGVNVPNGVQVMRYEYAIEAMLSLLETEQDLRLAIIYKRGLQGVVSALEPLLSEKASWGVVDVSRVSVLSVEAAKGLEFDAVLVLANEMTESERYISYTRALDYLYIDKLRDVSMGNVDEIDEAFQEEELSDQDEEIEG